MKLESLKSSKFEAFKSNELQNAMKVLGGAPTGQGTVQTDTGQNDHCDDSSDDEACGDVVCDMSVGTVAQVQQWVTQGVIQYTAAPIVWTTYYPTNS